MTSEVQNETYIFFDTNMLENRFNKDCFNVFQPTFSDEYFYIKNFIIDNHLELYVKICIPEIVLMEIKKHLVDCYKSQCDSLTNHLNNFKKIFGLVKNADGLGGMKIKFYATINGENYKFDIVYELNSKTLIEVIDFGECNEE